MHAVPPSPPAYVAAGAALADPPHECLAHFADLAFRAGDRVLAEHLIGLLYKSFDQQAARARHWDADADLPMSLGEAVPRLRTGA